MIVVTVQQLFVEYLTIRKKENSIRCFNMYKREDVYNLRNNNTYEITELDERIYNETGYVIHQVDGMFIYKQRFGSVLNQLMVCIGKDGTIETERWYICTADGDSDLEFVETPEKMLELCKLKHQKLLETYWKED
jgi:hypothetical protein